MRMNRSAFIGVALGCILSFMVVAPCPAGTGQVVDGTPKYVNLNLYYTYAPTDKAVMKNAFEQASRLLFNSTNGQFRIGSVRVSTNSAFQNRADAWINSGASGAYTDVGGLGTPGLHMTFFENRHRWTDEDGPGGNERGQFGISHEFGHYGFNLYDEYPIAGGGYPGANCVSSTSTVACIMDGGTTIHPNHLRTEWCTVNGGGLTTSHVTTPNTPQQGIHGHSCWEEIASYSNSEYGVALAAPAAVDTSDPAGLGTLGWVTIGDRLRYVLALDRSFSMSVDNKEPLAKQAAALFVDLCKKDVGESIGVVSFSNTAVSDYPIHEVVTAPDTKTEAIDAINAVVLENMTALGDGLRKSLNEITGSGTVSPDDSAAEAIVLLSDGVHNFGAEAPSGVLPDLRARGVRVFTIGLGDPSDAVYPLDETTLMDISSRTGASYTHAVNATELSGIYATYAAEIRGQDSYPEASGELDRGASAEHGVLVDRYTREETFLVHWPYGNKAFRLRLKRPDGTFVSPRTAGVEFVSKDRYAFFRIRKPKPGTWTMVVTASKGTDTEGKRLRYTTRALAGAPGLSCKVAPVRAFYKKGEAAAIRASVVAGGVPVARAEVAGTITLPGGRKVPVRLYDDGRWKEHGDGRANDGVYSAFFRGTESTGSYGITLKVDARRAVTATPDEPDAHWLPKRVAPFTRQAKGAFMVGRPETKAPTTEKKR